MLSASYAQTTKASGGASSIPRAGAVAHRLGRINPTFHPLPLDSDGQVTATIRRMQALAWAEARTEAVVAALAMARRCARSGAAGDVVAAIHLWVRTNCRFVADHIGVDPLERAGGDTVVELLLSPTGMLFYRAGDCDDYACLVAAMLLAAGIPCAFVTVAADDSAPADYSHVYVAAYPQGRRIAIDASHGPWAGWEVQRVFRRQEWPVPQREAQCA